ncbi:hypothetical protein COLO4_27106 [Corchorus olitorius]|uniref:Uncharacterized protein n=1 Tax=Corchorus olitorius TaxID=93759 RepID=A0A1R3HSQ7_9ROSI|nr:hypothetical protein COLO4_27106 [Corchorus olitorius]
MFLVRDCRDGRDFFSGSKGLEKDGKKWRCEREVIKRVVREGDVKKGLLREVNELARLVVGDENKLRWAKTSVHQAAIGN